MKRLWLIRSLVFQTFLPILRRWLLARSATDTRVCLAISAARSSRFRRLATSAPVRLLLFSTRSDSRQEARRLDFMPSNRWPGKARSVSLGGFPPRALFYQPRFGAAYDLFGTGNTVLRGGWGRFYYHSGQFTNGLDASAGVATANISPSNWVGGTGCPTNNGGAALFAAYLGCLNVAATPA